jgi:hypothetical protein
VNLSSKQRWIAAAVLVLLVLFLLRPGVSRLKSRIITSISAGVGRPVDIGSVHVHLLPRPGFEIENLVIYDDPLYGAEPMLRANEVTADLRIVSLFKGRLEIARLDLAEPSFNLVHRDGGGWNLQALLERAAHNSTAPTGAARSLPRPQFPYIEGSSGRINFKSGAEKRPYALTNADFSLWQESEDTWGIRLKAQPFRTDLNLTDVGELRVGGTWKRAQSFKETPVELSLEWSKGQLGQLTKFFTAMDKGWRGAVLLDVSLSGSPAKLKISSTATVDDFRRFDITSGKALRLTARCEGEYRAERYGFQDVKCSAPIGEGGLTLTGDVGLPGSRRYTMSLKAENIPAKAALALLERAKKNIPDDLVTDGTLKGAAGIEQNAAAGTRFRFHGQGEIADLRVSSRTTKADVGPATVTFRLVDDAGKANGQRKLKGRLGVVFPKDPHLEIGPVALNPAHGTGLSAAGWLSRSSYSLSITGEGEIAKVLRLARTIGLPAPAANPEGTAQLNLQVAGSWVGLDGQLGVGFPAPQVTGSAKLRNVRTAIPGASGPLEISTADLQLASDKIQITKLNANALGAAWSGAVELPRGCGTPDICDVHFNLNTQEFALAKLNEWINGRAKSRPWYRVLEPTSKSGLTFLRRLHASGQVTASRFVLHKITANNVSARFTIDSGKLLLNTLDADLLNGKHQGNWELDFSDAPSACNGSGTISGISLAKLSVDMGGDWATGTASGNYEVAGPCSGEFWQSAEGKLRAEIKNGALLHVLIGDDPEPLAITRLTGEARLLSGKFELDSAKLTSSTATYELSGSLTLGRDIDVKMTRAPADSAHTGYSITGTLSQPNVSPLSSTEQAKLKPLASK